VCSSGYCLLHLSGIAASVDVSKHTASKAYSKSAAGRRRTVPLPSWLIEIVTHHAVVYPPGIKQHVFPNTVGMPLRRTLFRRVSGSWRFYGLVFIRRCIFMIFGTAMPPGWWTMAYRLTWCTES
jgi:hypothetical protein